MFRKTKIVCTLGPAVDSEVRIRALIDAGMNVARINCSHAEPEMRERWLGWVRKIADEKGVFVAVMFDLQGPKFRLGEIRGEAMTVEAGDSVIVGLKKGELPIQRPEILGALSRGRKLLIGDGDVTFRVASVDGPISLVCLTGGEIRSRQG
ncbi:MAG: pyruvate kinase, partial [Fimbriimonadales bacterium]